MEMLENSLTSIQTELEKAKEKLKGVEETIKKSIGRDVIGSTPARGQAFKRKPNDGISPGGGDPDGPKQAPQRPRIVYDSPSVKGGGRLGPPVSRFERSRLGKQEDRVDRVPAKKRLGEQTITVFSRLSGPPKDADDYDTFSPPPPDKRSRAISGDGGGGGGRHQKMSSEVKLTSQVIATDAPSRKEVLAAQAGSQARNRRMFGALLGTLQKFRQEENQLKEKEEKRALVEKKLEEAAMREKEELKKTRQELFSTRRQQQMEIRQLEFKLMRLKQFNEWETTKNHLMNFIQTKASPQIFYLPKILDEKSTQLLEETREQITKLIADKKEEVARSIANFSERKGRSRSEKEEDKEHHKDEISKRRLDMLLNKNVEDVKRSEEIVENEDFEVDDSEYASHDQEMAEVENQEEHDESNGTLDLGNRTATTTADISVAMDDDAVDEDNEFDWGDVQPSIVDKEAPSHGDEEKQDFDEGGGDVDAEEESVRMMTDGNTLEHGQGVDEDSERISSDKENVTS